MQRPRDGGIYRAVSEQRLGNHDPFLGNILLIMEQLDYQNRTVFSMWSVPRCYSREVWSLVDSSVRESVKKGLSRRQRSSHCWSRCQETSSSGLGTLDCVL
jgi:hypothetical protein